MRKSMSTILAAAVMVACAPHCRADTITTFDASGTAFNTSAVSPDYCPPDGTPCAFSGVLSVDVTTGTITNVDIRFPGLMQFYVVSVSEPTAQSDWLLLAENGPSGDTLYMVFTTASTPGSLVGFDGGSILGGSTAGGPFDDLFFTVVAGSIAVSEPGSLLLMLAGLSALGLFVVRRRAAFGYRRSDVPI